MVFVSLPAVVMVMVSTDYDRTVADATTRRRYADRFGSDRDRHSGNRDHESDPHASESPIDAHSNPDPTYRNAHVATGPAATTSIPSVVALGAHDEHPRASTYAVNANPCQPAREARADQGRPFVPPLIEQRQCWW